VTATAKNPSRASASIDAEASSWRLSCQIDENGSKPAGAGYLDRRFAVVERRSLKALRWIEAGSSAVGKLLRAAAAASFPDGFDLWPRIA